MHFAQQFTVDPGAIVKPFQIRTAGESLEIAPPEVILRQQEQVIGRRLRVAHGPILTCGGGDVRFDTEDGSDTGLFGGGVQVDRTEEIPVIRQTQSPHTDFGGLGDKTLHPGGTVQQRIV